MIKFLTVLFFITGICYSQSRDPDKILDEVKSNFNKVMDYEVNVRIKVDVDFIKIPDADAKIYYKQPDKIHVEADRFALLPKEGLNFSPLSLLNGNHTAIYEREDKINGSNVSIVKVIPIGGDGDIILTTLWIDQAKDVVRKIESTTKIAGTFSIDLKYDESKPDYPLPISMVFSFNVEQMSFPKGMTGERSSESKAKKKDKQGAGKVYINYYNYQVNKGIPDNIFEVKKK